MGCLREWRWAGSQGWECHTARHHPKQSRATGGNGFAIKQKLSDKSGPKSSQSLSQGHGWVQALLQHSSGQEWVEASGEGLWKPSGLCHSALVSALQYPAQWLRLFKRFNRAPLQELWPAANIILASANNFLKILLNDNWRKADHKQIELRISFTCPSTPLMY